jgi:hypothetical protein
MIDGRNHATIRCDSALEVQKQVASCQDLRLREPVGNERDKPLKIIRSKRNNQKPRLLEIFINDLVAL